MKFNLIKVELAENGVVVYEGTNPATPYAGRMFVFNKPADFAEWAHDWLYDNLKKEDN